MLAPALLAILVGGVFAALWLAARVSGARMAAVAWLLYAPYEFLMYTRVLCSGECNIRIDLLLMWPLLLVLSLAVPIRWFLRRDRRRGGSHGAAS